LIDNIGIYPTGTWVRLDTEEIGLVIDTNSAYLLSPKINIMFDRGEKMLLKPRIVDLLRQKNIHIKGPLEENTIQRLQEVLSK
jgi:hypothetical protein